MNNFLWLGEDSREVTIMQRLRRKKESIQVLKRRVATTGFFAGLIWSTVWTFLAFFNFSELSLSSFFLEGWTDAKWVEKWPGQLLSIFLWSILSIGIAYKIGRASCRERVYICVDRASLEQRDNQC